MNDSPLAPGSRVVIAGASGLIGSALTRSLSADGYEVVRLVRRAPAPRARCGGIRRGAGWTRGRSPGARRW